MIYRKPHEKSSNKSVKKIQNEQLTKKQQPKKFVAKPAPNMTKPPKIPLKTPIQPNNTNNKTVSQKVEQLEKLVQKIQNTKASQDLQSILLREIKGIKNELSEIKTQIGMKGTKGHQHYQNHNHHEHEHEEEHNDEENEQHQEEEENIMNFGTKNNGSHLRQLPVNNNRGSFNAEEHQTISSRPNIKSFSSTKPKQTKVLLEIGKIQPYMKEFKLQNTQNKIPQAFYYGYHKKSSKPVIVKYCEQNKNMDFVNGMYERLWKNIVKARTICINKVYDLNEPLATNILVIEQNKCGLQGIQMNPFKISQQILKALQFFHECGYLYRNMHPSHVMLNYDNNIVLLDLKNMKKFVDFKGKVIDLKGNDEGEELDEFVANSRIKGSLEGRKDDLECLGYLTLFMLEGKLPWNAENMIQVRSKLLLNQIFGKYPGLLKFMIEVHKLPTHDMPNYSILSQMIQS